MLQDEFSPGELADNRTRAYSHTRGMEKNTRGFSKSNKDFKVSCICSMSRFFRLETLPVFLQLVVRRATKNCRNKTKLKSKQYGDREVKLAKKTSNIKMIIYACLL